MTKVSRSILASAACVMVLAGCQKSDAPTNTSSGSPPPAVANAAPISEVPKGDPSVPDASTVFAAQDAADKAKATENTAALQVKPAPQEEMTKADESVAMPLPAQANDHSTTALDKNTGG